MIWNSLVYKPASESEVGRISVAVSDDASAVRRMGQVGIDSFKFPKGSPGGDCYRINFVCVRIRPAVRASSFYCLNSVFLVLDREYTDILV